MNFLDFFSSEESQRFGEASEADEESWGLWVEEAAVQYPCDTEQGSFSCPSKS